MSDHHTPTTAPGTPSPDTRVRARHRHVSMLAVLAAASLGSAAPLAAQTDPTAGIVTMNVLPGWTTDRGTRMAAFRLRLAPGWKTYWRAPGDAGIPPRLTLQGSQNVASVAMSWPVPQVFDQAGMRSIGYAEGVVLPVEVTTQSGGDIRLAGTLDIGVCNDICVPARLAFDAVIPEGGARDGQIVAALIDRPLSEAEAGVGAVTCALEPTDRGMAIAVHAQMPPLGGPEAVVIEAGDAEIWVSEPVVSRSGDTLDAVARMVHASGGAFSVDRSAVRITVISGGQAVDIRGCTAG